MTRVTRKTADTVLGNGLRVVAVRTPGAPLAELRLVLPYARTDPRTAAVQQLLADLLTAAVGDRARQEVADRAADLGAELSTVVTAESLIVATGVLAEGLPGALELLADLLLRPVYPESELAHAAGRSAAVRDAGGDRPRLRRALLEHAFGAGHPHHTPAVERTEPVRTEELYALHGRAVVPHGAVLLVMSAEEPDRVTALVEGLLGGWTGGPSGLVLPPFARSTPRPGRIAQAPADGTAAQALVLAAGPAVPAAEPGHAPLHLAELMLGGYASSLLARRVRDRHGLAYAVSASVRENRAGSWLEIESAGAPGTADRTAEEVVGALRELAGNGPDPREVERARAYACGFTRFALATRSEEASALAGFLAAGLPLDWLDGYRDTLREVTAEQVAEAARHFLDPNAFLIATLDTVESPAVTLDVVVPLAATLDVVESPVTTRAPDNPPVATPDEQPENHR
ncbi:M16 family metallopeptidase [Streptomyces sp. NPDC004111]|uniref:M16 family metallopeptidase n=1 Tax=Streptomyces sp. NPDC004111 TaxID=3364690 RepID=UPI003698AC4F